MAKVHKAHKSSKKYGFQKKKLSLKVLLIILAVVVVAGIGLKVAYDKYVYGELTVEAPTAAQMNNIADNWAILNTHTDKFLNYYSLMAGSEDGTDGNGGVALLYVGNDKVDQVSIQINTLGADDPATPAQAIGAYYRTGLIDFINGVAPWGQMTKEIVVGTENMIISISDADAADLDTAIASEILAEIEAVIAAGPVVPERVEEVAETTEE